MPDSSQRKPRGELLQKAAEVNGFDSIDDMLTVATYDYDNRCPGICVNCEEVYEDVEADAKGNHCHTCNKKRVISVLVLAELI